MNNKKIKNKKKKGDSFYIFGLFPVVEAIRNNPKDIISLMIDPSRKRDEYLDYIFSEAKKKKIKLENFDKKKNKKIFSDNENLQGVVALIKGFEYNNFSNWKEKQKEKEESVVLVLDHIKDVGNFGSIIRSAAALGVDAIFVAGNNQAPVNGAVFKVSAGNISKVDIVRVSNISQLIDRLKENGYWIYSLDMSEDEKSNIYKINFDKKTAIILGSEEDGVSQKILEKSDFIISIPMENNVESMNAAVSSAIAVYEYKRQFN